MNDFLARTTCGWTLPGGVSCDDDDDQARLERLFTKFPRIEKAVAKCIARAATTSADVTAAAPPTPATSQTRDVEVQALLNPAPQSPPVSTPISHPQPDHPAADTRQPAFPLPTATATAPLPKRPIRLAAARIKYNEHYSRTLETNNRTNGDKAWVLDMFVDYLRLNHPELGDDPWVHTIDAAHVTGFLPEQSHPPANLGEWEPWQTK